MKHQNGPENKNAVHQHWEKRANLGLPSGFANAFADAWKFVNVVFADLQAFATHSQTSKKLAPGPGSQDFPIAIN